VYKKFSGKVSASEFLQSIFEVQGHIKFDTLRYAIDDFSETTSFEASDADVRIFAGYSRGAVLSNSKIRLAFVTSDEHVSNLVSFFNSPELSSYHVEIFSTLNDVREWIETGYLATV
jgi:hypothetical protein